MKKVSIARILVTLFFAGLLAVPWMVRHFSAAAKTSKNSDAKDALARYGFSLEEVGHSAGIDFLHQAPALDSSSMELCPKWRRWALRFLSLTTIATAGPTST